MHPEFEPWPKIPRKGKGSYVITEKLDGTNAQIYIVNNLDEDLVNDFKPASSSLAVATEDNLTMFVGSRTRYITPKEDNYGFAKWCQQHATELFKLGVGRHFGEWVGWGIQKNKYSFSSDERRLFLFNVARWGIHNPNTPMCCSVVPKLLLGDDAPTIDKAMAHLKEHGSYIGLTGSEPEGVIAYHTATKQLTKATFKSPNGKWVDNANTTNK